VIFVTRSRARNKEGGELRRTKRWRAAGWRDTLSETYGKRQNSQTLLLRRKYLSYDAARWFTDLVTEKETRLWRCALVYES